MRRPDTLLNQQAPMNSNNAGYIPQTSSLGSAANVECSDCLPFSLPTPSFVSSDDPFPPSNHNAYQSMVQFSGNLDNQFLNYISTPHSIEQNDLSQLQVENLSPLQGTDTTSFPQGRESRSHIPSLREIRALNRLPSSPPSLAWSNSKEDEGDRGNDYRRINSELTVFCSTVFTTQAEIAGVSSVVAEYLAWARKRPLRSTEGTVLEANWAVILETLELRVRELHHMAETRHRAAWEQMMALLKADGLDVQLSALDGEVQKRIETTKKFFQESYDVTSPLPEQIVHG